jgi:hypothetical protein
MTLLLYASDFFGPAVTMPSSRYAGRPDPGDLLFVKPGGSSFSAARAGHRSGLHERGVDLTDTVQLFGG